MTQFGDDMKAELLAINENGLITTEEHKKQTHAERNYEYKFEVSGVDMKGTRIMNGKETQTLYIFLSQTDAEGHPLIFIKQKNGSRVAFDEKSYKSFADGLSVKKCYPNGTVKTGSDYIPSLYRNDTFIRILYALETNPGFVELIKKGYVNTDIIYSLTNDKYYYRSQYNMPWFISNVDRYSRSSNIFDEENYNKQNMHEKLYKFIINDLMERYKINFLTAQKIVFSDSNDELIKFDYDAMKSFIIIANAYDEPFAIKCYQQYMDHHLMNNLKDQYLTPILTIPNDRRRYGTDMAYHARYGGTLNLLNPKNMDNIKETMTNFISFEKNRFWQFIVNSVRKGRGTRINTYLNMWSDYLHNCIEVDGEIKEKYPEDLAEKHDVYSEAKELMQKFNDHEKLMNITEIASKVCDITTKKWQMKVFRTQRDYVIEARQTGSCVAGYVGKAINGTSFVCSFRPKDADETLLTVEISNKTEEGRYNKWDMIQIQGLQNRDATKDEMAILKQFQKKIYKNLLKEGLITEEEYKTKKLPSRFAGIPDITVE